MNTYPLQYSWASLVAQLVENPPAMWETWVQSLCWEDPLEKGTATHPSILGWRFPRTSMASQKSWTWLSSFHFHEHLLWLSLQVQCSVQRGQAKTPISQCFPKGVWLLSFKVQLLISIKLGADILTGAQKKNRLTSAFMIHLDWRWNCIKNVSHAHRSQKKVQTGTLISAIIDFKPKTVIRGKVII